MKIKEVYLDGAANTPVDRRVLKKMKPYLKPKHVGNSFAIHDFGIKNMIAIEDSRSKIASILKVTSNEIFFTSGASESNNWVIKSIVLHAIFVDKIRHPHIICGFNEHSSVFHTCEMVEKWGAKVTYLRGTSANGSINRKDIKESLLPNTILVCIMAINNETGVQNHVEDITSITKKKKILSLVDCTQWMSNGGKELALASVFPHADFMTFSAHKFYGPTGVGCLVARKDVKDRLDSYITGGAQENGMRGGTPNTAGIVGMAKALELMSKEDYNIQYFYLYNYLIERLCNVHKFCKVNVVPDHYNIISLNFSKTCHYDNLAAVFATFGVAVSSGSACDITHQSIEDFNPSRALSALNLNEDEIRNTIRVSFTKYTTFQDICYLIKVAIEIVKEEEKKRHD